MSRPCPTQGPAGPPVFVKRSPAPVGMERAMVGRMVLMAAPGG